MKITAYSYGKFSEKNFRLAPKAKILKINPYIFGILNEKNLKEKNNIISKRVQNYVHTRAKTCARVHTRSGFQRSRVPYSENI